LGSNAFASWRIPPVDRSGRSVKLGGSLSRSTTPSVELARPFRAVLFDLGNTLVNVRDFNQIEEMAHRIGIEVDGEALAHAFQDVESETEKPAGNVVPFDRFWGQVFVRSKREPVRPGEVEAFTRALQDMELVPERFTDVGPCIEVLEGQGYRLGVVTNWRDEGSARKVLEKVGLLEHFSAVVAAGTEGVAKPDPEIFRRAANRVGARPSETVYVGDLPTTDARGAAAAGLTAVWLHRGGTGFGDDPPEITSLLELPRWIELAGAALGRSR
jgi:HAD superfamily hydrolase (TIGR01549 family)